jgi:[acyl-carrier-protein] S-malonyltransferase
MAAILGLEDQAVELLCQTAVAVTHKRHQERRQEHLKDPHTNDSTVETTVEPANYNAPGQVVIAGSTDGIAEAVGLLKTDPRFSGGKAIPLAVSAPFHCRLMAPAREKMADLFSHTSSQKVHPLKMPYIPNRTGRLSQEAGTVIQLLTEQIDHPVLWKQSIVTVLEAQFSVAIEFGPGKVLSGLTKRIANHTSKSCNLLALNDTASFKNLESVLKGLS